MAGVAVFLVARLDADTLGQIVLDRVNREEPGSVPLRARSRVDEVFEREKSKLKKRVLDKLDSRLRRLRD